MTHSNEHKTPGEPLIKELILTSRLEAQIGTNWFQIDKGAVVYQLSEPALLLTNLRQMTRWPDDWSLGPEWYDTLWITCWVPRLGRKAQIRVKDTCQPIQKNKNWLTKLSNILETCLKALKSLGTAIGRIKA